LRAQVRKLRVRSFIVFEFLRLVSCFWSTIVFWSLARYLISRLLVEEPEMYPLFNIGKLLSVASGLELRLRNFFKFIFSADYSVHCLVCHLCTACCASRAPYASSEIKDDTSTMFIQNALPTPQANDVNIGDS